MLPVAKFLKQARLERGWSQTTLAVEAGVSLDTVARYEQGHGRPSAPSARRLALALELDPAEVLVLLADAAEAES